MTFNRSKGNQLIALYVISFYSTLLCFDVTTTFGSCSGAPPQYVAQFGNSIVFGTVFSIASDNMGNLYIPDANFNHICKYKSDGTLILSWGTQGSGPGQFQSPTGVCVGPNGLVYIVDWGNNRIQVFDADSTFVTSWGSQGVGNGQFTGPRCIATNGSGDVYVTDSSNNRIQRFTSSGQFLGKWGTLGSGNGQFSFPAGIAVTASGTVYVVDNNNARVQYFTATGTYLGEWGKVGAAAGQFFHPFGVALDPGGCVVIVDTNNGRLQTFTATGQFINSWGHTGGGNGEFGYPCGACFLGNDIFIADRLNFRIQQFAPGGVSTVPINPSISSENDIATLVVYPNPVTSRQTISIRRANALSEMVLSEPLPQNAALSIYDAIGKLVEQFPAKQTGQGDGFSFRWDPKFTGPAVVASGVYFVRLTQDERVLGQGRFIMTK